MLCTTSRLAGILVRVLLGDKNGLKRGMHFLLFKDSEERGNEMECREDFLDDSIIRGDMQGIYQLMSVWNQLKGMSFYVTGATGMIASYFVMFLIYLNEVWGYHIEIYAGVRSTDKARWRFGKYIDRNYFHLMSGDINKPVMIEESVHYVIHAASLASPQYYGKMPVETMLPNVIGTYELLKYAAAHPLKGFLLFSSGSVYGNVGELDSIREATVGSMDWLVPGNVYGESKRCAEALCHAYFREFEVPIKIARIHHTYGPTMDVWNDKRVFSEFTNNILSGHNIILKSAGEDQRAFCYLQDTVSALFKILLEGMVGECYNIGNPNAYISVRKLAEILTEIFPEKNLKVEYREREDTGYCASSAKRLSPVNVDKLKSLGWEAEVNVEEGFTRSLNYIAKRWKGNL